MSDADSPVEQSSSEGPKTEADPPAETKAKQEKPIKPRMYRCPGCSANLKFEPVDGCLSCPYCGRQEKIPESVEEIRENSFEDYLHAHPGQLLSLSEQFVEHQCPACNAILELPSEQIAGDCPFCGSLMVICEKSSDPLIAPEAVLPMLITSDQGQTAVRAWLNSRWFAPNSLKKFATQEVLQGIYLPYWTFDSSTRSLYSGERGEYYYVTEVVTQYVDGKPQQVQRQVRRTRWYPASGRVERWFDDVTMPGSRSLNQSHLDRLEPWDLAELKPYDSAFLSGFKAERYRVELPLGFQAAKQKMERVINDDVCRDIGGDEQRVLDIQTAYSAVTFKHVLLPVWAGAYRLQGKVYQVVVNGRTSEVMGDRPYSVWKILFACLLAAIALGIFATVNDQSHSPNGNNSVYQSESSYPGNG